MSPLTAIIPLGTAVLLAGCASPRSGPGKMETWHANIAPAPGRELPAQTSIRTSDFVFPWSAKRAPRTDFSAHVHKGRLHFSFDCDDRDLVIVPEWHGESTLDGEDRVEIFFARDAALARYFCIEIDPLGRVHDYAARNYRRFDSAWNFPGLRTAAQRTATGYRVDASVPLATFTKLLGTEARRGGTLHIGLFRAEFFGTTRGEKDDNWLSWVRPAVPKPDFHVPSAFAKVTLP